MKEIRNIYPSQELTEKALKIKAIVCDVDGVLTDGTIYTNQAGDEEFVHFSVYDGSAVRILEANKMPLAILSARESICVYNKCKKWGIETIELGAMNKLKKIKEIAKKWGLALDEIAYIGDEIVDYPVMQIIGLGIAPASASLLIRGAVDYITKVSAGYGVLRESAEILLSLQGSYKDSYEKYLEQFCSN